MKHKNNFAFLVCKEIGCGGDWIHVAQYRGHCRLLWIGYEMACSVMARKICIFCWNVSISVTARYNSHVTTSETRRISNYHSIPSGRSQWPAAILGSNPTGGIDVYVLSGRGLCDELITRPEKSY
jgi:hypothetical protein